MPSLSAKKPHSANVLHKAQAKGLALAAGTLPRIAEAAERTGQSIARASSSAGHAAAEKLRTMQPSTAATVASAVAASGMIGPMLRFALRRPFAAAIGGILIAQAGKLIWNSMQNSMQKDTAPAAPAAQAVTA